MNINKGFIALFSFLILLMVVTFFHFNRLRSNQVGRDISKNEIFITNMACVPAIVSSYEKVKDDYGKKNTLFFRYSKDFCFNCIFSYLEALLAFQKDIGKEYVWIFPAYPDDRGSRIQLNNELAKFNYRNIPPDSLLVPSFEGERKCYFAWINSEGEIDMVFIPDPNRKQYLRQFFLEVKQKINSNSEKVFE